MSKTEWKEHELHDLRKMQIIYVHKLYISELILLIKKATCILNFKDDTLYDQMHKRQAAYGGARFGNICFKCKI